MSRSPAHLLPGAAGAGLAAVFGALAHVRHGKPLHPRGVVARAVLDRTGCAGARWGVPWLDEPGADAGISRLSRASGLPAPLPDVLGLAVRIERGGDRHDLLLATTGLRPGLRHLLCFRRPALRSAYTSLLPYDAAGTLVVLAAVPVVRPGGAPGGGPGGQVAPADVARALSVAPAVFRLLVARPRGPWEEFGRLTLSRDPARPVQDEPLRFDPVRNPLPGLAHPPALRALREPAYAAARSKRLDAAVPAPPVPEGMAAAGGGSRDRRDPRNREAP